MKESIAEMGTGSLVVACSDGTVTQFGGRGKDFVDEKRDMIKGRITSLSISADDTLLLVGTAEGEVRFQVGVYGKKSKCLPS